MVSIDIDVEEIYKKDKKLKKEDVNALIEWMKKQPHLPKVTELQTALFLHSCYYSNEAAKNTIDTYFTVKTVCQDLFGSRNPGDPMLETIMRTVATCPLPKLTSSGELLIFLKLMDSNTDNFTLAPQVNLFDMITLIHIHQHGPPNGIHIVMDMKGVILAHMLKMNLVVIKQFLYYLQEGMPIRLKSIHLFNVVSFMDKILALIKPFMKTELLEMLVLHTGIDTIFTQLPKECFPQEYGGSAEPLEILQEKTRCQIVNNPEFWKFQISQVVDESKRQGKPKNISEIFGVEGSFKKARG